MPYSSIKELPLNIKNSLPVGAQKIYLSTFNAVLREGGSEEEAMKAGWNNVMGTYRSGQRVIGLKNCI